ncbi:MAG: hypothetical protein M3T56_10245 [Chloroflexota bacterium]|nr:hypothetical protein [Chloroflexota bacterium]
MKNAAARQEPHPAGERSETLSQTSAQLGFDTSKPFPDVFADSVQTGVGPFGVQLTFALTDPERPERQVVSRVRLSPQLAFVMTQMLRRTLRQARDQGIGITVPEEVMRQLGLEDEL